MKSEDRISNLPLLLAEISGCSNKRTSKKGTFDCPMHPATPDTLYCRASFVLPGGLELGCSEPYCRFHGGVLDLAATYEDTGLNKALQLFWPDGRLYGKFFDSTSCAAGDREILRLAAEGRELQDEVKAYLDDNAVRGFMNSNYARPVLKSKGIREDMFLMMKLYMVARGIPDCLIRHFGRKTEEFDKTMIFPYVNSGDVVQLVLENLVNGERRVCQIVKDVPGLYLPEPIPFTATRLIVGQSEIEAMLLLTKCNEIGICDFHPVCASDVTAFGPNIDEIVLISHPERLMTIEDALKYCSCGCRVKVADVPVPLMQVDGASLGDMTDESVDLRIWLADRLIIYFQANGVEDTVNMLNTAGMPDKEKSAICDLLMQKSANRVLVDLVGHCEPLHVERNIMDVTIKRTIFGYYQVEPKTRRLSNFMFQAHSILGKDGNDDETKFISGRIVTPEFSHDITLPDYAFDSTAGLALQIWRSLVSAGHSDFQPCLQSSVEPIGWRNVFLMFDEVPCISESAVLGISGDYFAHPSVRIAVDGQQDTGLLPEALRRRYGDMYGAVTASAEPSAPVMRRLLMSREPAITVMRELLAWLLYQTAAASVAGKDFRAGHILVPYYSQGDDNARIATGLAEMFNGHSGIRSVSNEKESGKLCDDARRLGRLPVIIAVKGKMEPEPWLRRLDSSAIILCPAGTCMKMNATADIRFMAAQETGQAIAPDIFRAVLGAWPDMLTTTRQLIVEHSRAPVDQFGGSLLAMFARRLHASYRDPQLFSERYVPPVADTRTISRIMHYLVETGAVTLAGTEWAFRKGRDSDVGYRAKDMVRIRPRTLRAAFDSCIPGVKVSSLQKCLEERFGVTGVSSRGELEIPASAWQEQLRLHVPVRQITAEDLGFKDNEDDCIEVKSECLPEPR